MAPIQRRRGKGTLKRLLTAVRKSPRVTDDRRDQIATRRCRGGAREFGTASSPAPAGPEGSPGAAAPTYEWCWRIA